MRLRRRLTELVKKVEELERRIYSVDLRMQREVSPIISERREAALKKARLRVVAGQKIVIAPAGDKRSREEVLSLLSRIMPEAVGCIPTITIGKFGEHTGYGTALNTADGWSLLRGTENYPYNLEKKSKRAKKRSTGNGETVS